MSMLRRWPQGVFMASASFRCSVAGIPAAFICALVWTGVTSGSVAMAGAAAAYDVFGSARARHQRPTIASHVARKSKKRYRNSPRSARNMAPQGPDPSAGQRDDRPASTSFRDPRSATPLSLRPQERGDSQDHQPVDAASGHEVRQTRVRTYRTMCVRLCDGYYFPISFSVTRQNFVRDARACDSRCSGQARLFVYRNPGGELDAMEDLQGRPYRQLPTAFLYRATHVPSCKCQPDPWEEAAQDRHRVYALADASRKGDAHAAKQLHALQAKLQPTRGAVANSSKTAQVDSAPDIIGRTPSLDERATRVMHLGGPPKSRAKVSKSVTSFAASDWRNKIFRDGH